MERRRRGPALRQGIVEISLQATDLAGNRSRPTRRVPVVVRYILLARHRVEVPAGGRFAIGVATDMPPYRWRFAGKSGVAHGRVLRLTAPGRAGHYRVFVTAPDGHADSAAVIVRAAP